MKGNSLIIPVIILMALLLILAGCTHTNAETNTLAATSVASSKASFQEDSDNTEADATTLTISAASSLIGAMEEIKTQYIKENPKIAIDFNFGPSGSLQQQIEHGAEVDIFLSAAVKQMDALQAKNLIIEETRKNFLGNKVVLIVPTDSKLDISSFEELTEEDIKSIGIGELESVPAGQYGDEVLTKLGIKDELMSKFIFGKDVKQVLTWVETGNVDAGIVYSTDAIASDKILVAATAPEGTHKPIHYPAAVIKDTKHEKEAKDFIDYLYSEKARPIFEKYGFDFIAQ
jgi:molybdate transport system substrate-binding protein